MASRDQSPQNLPEILSEFAPALDSDPVFERPSGFEPSVLSDFRGKSAGQSPTGAWADGRSVFGLQAEGGPGFLDPGSFALGRHRTDMMSSIGIGGGVLASASADLSSPGPGSGFGGGSSGGGSSGGGGGGGGGVVSSGGDVA